MVRACLEENVGDMLLIMMCMQSFQLEFYFSEDVCSFLLMIH
jgi:hypothetical protein